MLIADTGPLVAMLNAKDRQHEACTALFRRFRGPVIVPAPIVTEVADFPQGGVDRTLMVQAARARGVAVAVRQQPARPAPLGAHRVAVLALSPQGVHHQRGCRTGMSAGLGRDDILSLLDDLPRKLAACADEHLIAWSSHWRMD
jgi:hypothetical protein